MKEINITGMSNKNSIRLMMENNEKYDQFQKIAEALSISKSTFQSTLNRDSLKVKDMQRVAALLGYEIKLVQKEQE